MSVAQSIFAPAPKPVSLLAYYRVLSPSAGVRVSPLCLGTMNFGDAWKPLMGECAKPTAFEILDHFFKAGGNFIDTSNNYQGEEAEAWIGEWMQLRQKRDQIVLATKFTTGFPSTVTKGIDIRVNYAGNHAKSLRVSLAASLKKLQTDYIDLLYVHWFDYTTSIQELMRGLHQLVVAGKVLYLGISDSPAWIVAKANQYARDHGLTPFSVYQGLWNASVRDFERDIIPMCQSEGMALAPWGVLGRGNFRTAAEVAEKVVAKEGRQGAGQSERQKAVSAALEKIAAKKGSSITGIALAYVMHKAPYVFPIIGQRSVKHLQGSIDALSVDLSKEDIGAIEDAVEFDIGFPQSFIWGYGGNKWSTDLGYSDLGLLKATAYIDQPGKVLPIRARQE